MDAVHCTTDIARTFPRDEDMKGDERFCFATSGVEERSAEDIHALHVYAGFSTTSFGAIGGCCG